MSAVADFVKVRLKLIGMTQAELSRESGIPDSNISRFLKGRTLGPEAMRKLCSALKLTDQVAEMLKASMLLQRATARAERVIGGAI